MANSAFILGGMTIAAWVMFSIVLCNGCVSVATGFFMQS